MRTLTDSLQKAQQAGALNPLYKIVLTKGTTTYTYEKDRILPSEHDEEMYSHRAKIVLDNSNHELDDKDLKGYDAVISYGFGKEYSPTAPLSVIDQTFTSDPNKLICILELEGMPNLMVRDEASENYIPDEEDTKTVKTLANAIAGATLDCFDHCQAFDVVWDAGYDTLADTYKPKDSFRVYTGGSRLAAFRRVLDFTANVPRFEADGKIHILKPVTTWTVYDSEYSLERGSHNFFSKAYRNSLVFPNRIVITSRTDDDPQYSGSAQVDGYASLPAKVKKTKYIQTQLESNDQANDIAEALIAKAEMGCARGQAEVPLNCGAEVFDYVKVTDSRQGDTRTGNLGYIHRRFGKDKWEMTFGFGNWFEWLKYQKMLKELEVYTDEGAYFSRLKVGSLYATLDEITDGPDLYVRQKSLHLDATGVYLTENTLYTIRVPGGPQHNLRKSDTAPSSPESGDFWIDTNYIPNKVKMWNGSSWAELTAQEVAEFNRGTIYRELKSVALTPDGLVLMDQVQAGTYGKILTAALSPSGLVFLDETVDGTYKKVKGTALTAEGLIWLDAAVDGTLYRKVSVTAVDVSGYIDLSKSGVVNKTAANISETAARKWAAESGADITGNNTAYDTARVSGTAAATVKGGAVRANAGLDASGFVSKIVPGAYIVLDGNVICTENFIVQGAVGVGKTLYVSGAISAGGGNVILDSAGAKVKGTGHFGIYYGSTQVGYIDCIGSSAVRFGSASGKNIDIVGGGSATKIVFSAGHQIEMDQYDAMTLPMIYSTTPPTDPQDGKLVYNYKTGYINIYSSAYGNWWHVDRTGGWA